MAFAGVQGVPQGFIFQDTVPLFVYSIFVLCWAKYLKHEQPPLVIVPSATTHTDLLLRASELGIPWRVVHNASIINAVGCCGLQLYHFGETVSIPFWTDTWKPESFVDKIEQNLKIGLHTLCLLGRRASLGTG